MRGMTMAVAAGVCAAVLGAGAAQAMAGTAWSTRGNAGVELTWSGTRAAPGAVTLTADRNGHLTVFAGLRRGRWAVPADGAIVAVRDLDRDGEPELLADLVRRGERGARRTVVVRWEPAEGRHRLTAHDWGAVDHHLRDINGDRRPEFVTGDARLLGFAGGSVARLPVRIWRFDAGEMVDVTRAFRRHLRADMAAHWSAITAAERRGGSPRAAIAAYVATAHLMGRPGGAWARVRARHTGPGAGRFFTALERRLVTLGYAATSTS